MRYLLALTIAVSLGLAFIACGGLVKGERPFMELQVGGDWLGLEYGTGPSKKEDEQCEDGYEAQSATYCCPTGMIEGPEGYCYEYREFEPLLQGEQTRTMEVTLTNAGEKPLKIDAIYMEDNPDFELNPYFQIKWLAGYPGPADFPYVVEPDLPTPPITFLIEYAPTPGWAGNPYAMLVIESNHPAFENKTFDNKYRMLFNVESVGPKARIDKTKITYGCVTGCSTTPVKIDNEGTDTLTIKSIDFASPSSEFSISNPPALPLDIAKKGAPDYNAVTFSVMYCPGDDSWEDENMLTIVTNDPSLPNSTLKVPVEVKQSPAILEFSTDSPFGYLDFSEEGQHSVNIFNTPASECDHLCSDTGHCCGCSIQLEDVTFDPPDTADWYNFVALDPTTEQQLTLPRALKGGASIRFDVYYQKPAGHPEDRNSTMCVKYVAPLSGPQDYCVSMIAKSQCQFSIGPVNQSLHFNSESPSEVKEKPVMLINSGSAPCTIDSVSVANKWDGASEDFALKEVFAGGTSVPAFSVMPVWVTYSPHSDDLSGKVTVEYQDELVGAVETVVQLKGAKENACALPVADPGDGYDGYTAGESVVLDGCGSSEGECGAAIYENGYIWFLMDKPAESTAQLNTESGCITQFVPDAAGAYEIGLIVYDKETFYQSDLATTTINVQ